MRMGLAAVLLTVLFSPGVLAATPAERGEYIVKDVGMCADCHTPRDAQGGLIQSAWLHGAPIDFRPLHPMPFAVSAPSIAGLPAGYTPEQLVHFLETGLRPNGSPARPPMPAYRLDPDDARAVVAYLATLR